MQTPKNWKLKKENFITEYNEGLFDAKIL